MKGKRNAKDGKFEAHIGYRPTLRCPAIRPTRLQTAKEDGVVLEHVFLESTQRSEDGCLPWHWDRAVNRWDRYAHVSGVTIPRNPSKRQFFHRFLGPLYPHVDHARWMFRAKGSRGRSARFVIHAKKESVLYRCTLSEREEFFRFVLRCCDDHLRGSEREPELWSRRSSVGVSQSVTDGKQVRGWRSGFPVTSRSQ